jgi:UDP-glucose 4-epimerase
MYQHTINEPMTIFGDGTQTRAFSYIDDSLEPLWKASQDDRASKQIINLGGIKEYSINEANEILRDVVGGGEVKYFEGRHEVKHSIPTWQKSIDLLDFEHKTDLKEGLTKMWKWVQTQPVRERFVWPFYELDKGIYSFWKTKK